MLRVTNKPFMLSVIMLNVQYLEPTLLSLLAQSVSVNEIVPKNSVHNSIFDFCSSTLFAIRLAG